MSNAAIDVNRGTVTINNTIVASHTIGLKRNTATAIEDYNLFNNVSTPYNGTIMTGRPS